MCFLIGYYRYLARVCKKSLNFKTLSFYALYFQNKSFVPLLSFLICSKAKNCSRNNFSYREEHSRNNWEANFSLKKKKTVTVSHLMIFLALLWNAPFLKIIKIQFWKQRRFSFLFVHVEYYCRVSSSMVRRDSYLSPIYLLVFCSRNEWRRSSKCFLFNIDFF